MTSRNIKRILYLVAAAIFLGIAGYEYAQAGFTTETILGGFAGVIFGIFAATGTG